MSRNPSKHQSLLLISFAKTSLSHLYSSQSFQKFSNSCFLLLRSPSQRDTSPVLRLCHRSQFQTYLFFFRCFGTGPIFVRKQFLNIHMGHQDQDRRKVGQMSLFFKSQRLLRTEKSKNSYTFKSYYLILALGVLKI